MKIAYGLIAVSVALVLVVALACASPSSATPLPNQAASGQAKDSSWQTKWDSILAKARTEGTVVVYTTANPATTNALREALQKKYGINTDFIVGKGEEFMTRIQTERRAGLYLGDVILAGNDTLSGIMKPQGILEPLGPTLILPEVTDPAIWLGTKMPFVDQDQLLLGFASRPNRFIAVNSDTVRAGDIKSYKDLLDPKWKGKITIIDPTVSGGGLYWAQTMLAVFGQQEGKRYLEQVVKQEPVITRDKRQQVEWLARNKYPLAVAPDVQTFVEFKTAGAPLSWETANEGVSLTYSGAVLGLLNQAAHPNASVVFIDWLLSKEAQTLFQVNYGLPSARLDVDKSGIDPAYVVQTTDKIILAENEAVLVDRLKVLDLDKEIFAPAMR